MNAGQHDVDLEQALIGCLLGNPKGAGPVIELAKSQWFYRPLHQQIWAEAEALHEAGEMPLRINLVKALERNGMEGSKAKLYLVSCHEVRCSAAMAKPYRDILHRNYMLRMVAEQGRRLETLAMEAEADPVTMVGLLGQAHEEAQKAIAGTLPSVSMADQVARWMDDLYERIERGGRPEGYLTGIRQLDELTGGVLAGKLWIVQAETSGGKSSLMIQMAYAFAKAGARVSIDSHEMGEADIISRIVAQETGIDLTTLTFGTPSAAEAKRAAAFAQTLAGMSDRLSVQKQTSDSIDDVLRSAASIEGLKVLFVDYLQLLTAGIRDRRVDVDTIARKLQTFCVTSGCSVVALAQINDDGTTRESRAITHAADVVFHMAHLRKSHTDAEGFEVFDDDGQPTCKVRGRITKQRNGPRGPVAMMFHKSRTRFYGAYEGIE